MQLYMYEDATNLKIYGNRNVLFESLWKLVPGLHFVLRNFE